MNAEIGNVCKWISENELALNIKKNNKSSILERKIVTTTKKLCMLNSSVCRKS